MRGILKGRGYATGVGDEGGFAPSLKSNREAIEVCSRPSAKTGRKAGADVFVAIDVAASELWAGGGRYTFKKSGEPDRTSDQMIRLYEDWLRQYPIVSIEDGLAEDDWAGWALLTKALGARVQLVGDDIFVTNPGDPEARHRGTRRQRDPDQAEPDRHGHRDARRRDMARDARYGTIISHRSGETEDSTIADLAVGTAAGQIKTGSASRTDRVCKYNQLLRIEEELGQGAVFAGRSAIRA